MTTFVRRDRLWMIGGALAAAVVLAVGWFFFIGPQNAGTAALGEQTVTAQNNLVTLHDKLVELRTQNARLGTYQAQLNTLRTALPADSGLPDFLRELHTVGEADHVSVNGLLVGEATQVPGTTTTVYALPITLTAGGSMADLERLLDQAQRQAPRAVLITGISVVPGDQGRTLSGGAIATISIRVFVAPGTTPAAPTGSAATASN
jgi:type IV pilus assembly protein PilO